MPLVVGWYDYIFHLFIWSKLIVVASHSCICNLKPFCNCICHYTLFLPFAMEDGYIGNCKNDWFGHKLQTHGLVWTRFLSNDEINSLPKCKLIFGWFVDKMLTSYLLTTSLSTPNSSFFWTTIPWATRIHQWIKWLQQMTIRNKHWMKWQGL
jgi:hypothetical protein